MLLCDDDDGVRDLLGEFLTSIGYTVRGASDGEEAPRERSRNTKAIAGYVLSGRIRDIPTVS